MSNVGEFKEKMIINDYIFFLLEVDVYVYSIVQVVLICAKRNYFRALTSVTIQDDVDAIKKKHNMYNFINIINTYVYNILI